MIQTALRCRIMDTEQENKRSTKSTQSVNINNEKYEDQIVKIF